MIRLQRWFGVLACFLMAVCAQAQDKLVYCNEPERIRDAGTYADARLLAGQSYTVFYHYRNTSNDTGDFVVQLKSLTDDSFSFTSKQGLADPYSDPPTVGRQAMARYLRAPEKTLAATKGVARFAYKLTHRQVASGMMTIKADRNVRLRIYYKHDKWDAPRMRTLVIDSPRCEVEVPLSGELMRHTYRIGMPERDANKSRLRDGSYGMIYSFKIAAPEGRRVRIGFIPRGGKAGLVGMLGGDLIMSEIYEAYERGTFCDATVGPRGELQLTTSPFGGVFYPVELTFQLLPPMAATSPGPSAQR
jgi:hypothetical protein